MKCRVADLICMSLDCEMNPKDPEEATHYIFLAFISPCTNSFFSSACIFVSLRFYISSSMMMIQWTRVCFYSKHCNDVL